jgi:hypothetical protein
MAIKSQGRTVNITAVGVPILRANPIRINPLEGVAKFAADSLKTDQIIKASDEAAQHQFATDPTTGLPILPEQKSSFTIFGAQYNKEIRDNYIRRLNSDIETTISNLAFEHNLDPAAFSGATSSFVTETVKQVDGFAKAYVRAKGQDLLQSNLNTIRNRWAQKTQAENARDRNLHVEKISTDLTGMIPGETTNQIISEAVDLYRQNNPTQFWDDKTIRRLERTIKKDHAEDYYIRRFRELTPPQQIAALQEYRKTGSYTNADGVKIIEPWKGMTNADLDSHYKALKDEANDQNTFQNREQINQKRELAVHLGTLIFDDLTVGMAESSADLFRKALASNPSAVIAATEKLKAHLKDKNTDRLQKKLLLESIPVINKYFEAAGLNAHKIQPDQFDDLTGADSAKILNQRLKLAEYELTTQKFAVNKDNIENTDKFINNRLDIVHKALEAAGAPFNVHNHMRKLMEGIAIDHASDANTANFIVLKTRAVSETLRIAAASLKRHAKEQTSRSDMSTVIKESLRISGMSDQAARMMKDVDRLRLEGASTSAIWKVVTKNLGQIQKAANQRDKDVKDLLPLMKNNASASITPLDWTKRRGYLSDKYFSTRPQFMIAQDSLGQGVWVSDLAVSHTARTGIIPQTTLDQLKTLANSKDTIWDAVKSYKAFRSLPQILGYQVYNQLDGFTRNKLEYLSDHLSPDGRADSDTSTIEYAFSPHFTGEPQNNAKLIYGANVKPAEQEEMFTTALLGALSKQKTGHETGFWQGLAQAVMDVHAPPSVRMFAAGEIGEAEAKTQQRYWDVTLGVNVDTLPQIFIDQAKEKFLNSGHHYMRSPGNPDEMQASIAKILSLVVANGDWGISEYGFDKPNKSTGYHITYKPVEKYALDDNKSLHWLPKFLEKRVNTDILRTVGNENEQYVSRDFVLIPSSTKVNEKGAPIYTVYLDKNMPAMTERFMKFGSGLDVDDKAWVETDILTVDIGPGLEQQNLLIAKKKAHAVKMDRLARVRDDEQRRPYLGGQTGPNYKTGVGAIIRKPPDAVKLDYYDINYEIGRNQRKDTGGWDQWFQGEDNDPIFASTSFQESYKWRRRDPSKKYREGEGMRVEGME